MKCAKRRVLRRRDRESWIIRLTFTPTLAQDWSLQDDTTRAMIGRKPYTGRIVNESGVIQVAHLP